jgi:hypothetical protein
MHVTVNDGGFRVEYAATSKSLRLLVGSLSNPALPTSTGHQETVYMRGIECSPSSKAQPCPYLQVANDADPKESSFLLWYEAGREVLGDGTELGKVEYFLIGEGVEPDVLVNFARSLTESGRAETPQPVTRVLIPWPSTPGP